MASQLQNWLNNSNIVAFKRVVRAGESSQDDAAYFTLYGGGKFESLWDHPRIAIKSPWGWTSAAGAYQAMAAVPGKVKTDTWGDFIKSEGPHDFSPRSQDIFAVWCIKRRKALDDVIAGNLEAAIKKCNKEWASLPGSPYGQPVRTMAQCKAVFLKYGGTLSETPIQKEAPVAPIVIPLLQVASAFISQLGPLFGSGSEVANRNIAAGTIVADTLIKATESINLQEAVEKIQNDPDALRDAKEAVAAVWPSITETGGGVVEARKAAGTQDQLPFYKNAAFWITVLLLPMLYGAGYAVLFTDRFSDDLKTVVVTAIFAGLLGSITGFFLGSSLSSQKKDAALGAK